MKANGDLQWTTLGTRDYTWNREFGGQLTEVVATVNSEGLRAGIRVGSVWLCFEAEKTMCYPGRGDRMGKDLDMSECHLKK